MGRGRSSLLALALLLILFIESGTGSSFATTITRTVEVALTGPPSITLTPASTIIPVGATTLTPMIVWATLGTLSALDVYLKAEPGNVIFYADAQGGAQLPDNKVRLTTNSPSITVFLKGVVASTVQITAHPFAPESNAFGSGAIVTVLKVDLIGAWEIDDVCNRVPNPRQNTASRLFVGTEGSNQTEIQIKASIQPVGAEGKVLCAAYDGPTHMVSGAFSTAGEAVLKFTPTGPAKNYLLRTGIDQDGDGTLSSSEFYSTLTNFDVTAFTTAHFDSEENYLHDQASSWKTEWAYPVGSSLLLHFLNDPSLPLAFDSTGTVNINCFTQDNLTHKAGATFASSGAGTLEEARWNVASEAGEKIVNSDEIAAVVNAILTAHSGEVVAYFAQNSTATSYSANWTSTSVPVDFAQNDYLPLAGYDLHVAFGHATLPSILVDVVFKKGLLGSLYVDSLTVTGSLVDLYDFNYEDGGLPARAAVLQIGWDPDIAGRDAGNIYFDRVFFQQPFSDWNFSF